MKNTLKAIGRPKEKILIFWQIISLFFLVYGFFQNVDLKWWALGVFGYFLIFCLGITITFHRRMAHKSYALWKPLEYLFAFFANIGCTGSSIGWIYVHRSHHKYSDKKGDPHSPVVLGKWGAIAGQYGEGFDKWMVRDIVVDPVHRFYHDYYNIIITAIPLFLAALSLNLFIFLFAVPVSLNTLASRLSNWIDHEPRFGVKVFHSNDDSHNVWWWSLLTFGEGWHNNHHGRPWSHQFGIKWYEVDFGKYIIHLLSLVGLATLKKNSVPASNE